MIPTPSLDKISGGAAATRSIEDVVVVAVHETIPIHFIGFGWLFNSHHIPNQFLSPFLPDSHLVMSFHQHRMVVGFGNLSWPGLKMTSRQHLPPAESAHVQ